MDSDHFIVDSDHFIVDPDHFIVDLDYLLSIQSIQFNQFNFYGSRLFCCESRSFNLIGDSDHFIGDPDPLIMDPNQIYYRSGYSLSSGSSCVTTLCFIYYN